MAISDTFLTYVKTHPFDGGDGSDAVLEQLYQAYAESHESDPMDIQDGFKELEDFLEYSALPEPGVRRVRATIPVGQSQRSGQREPVSFFAQSLR